MRGALAWPGVPWGRALSLRGDLPCAVALQPARLSRDFPRGAAGCGDPFPKETAFRDGGSSGWKERKKPDPPLQTKYSFISVGSSLRGSSQIVYFGPNEKHVSSAEPRNQRKMLQMRAGSCLGCGVLLPCGPAARAGDRGMLCPAGTGV